MAENKTNLEENQKKKKICSTEPMKPTFVKSAYKYQAPKTRGYETNITLTSLGSSYVKEMNNLFEFIPK